MNDMTLAEKEALTLFYNRFYDFYDEITNDDFNQLSSQLKFFKLREAFAVYKEIISYKPIKDYLKWAKQGGKPPLQGVIADDLFTFIRNLLQHFPLFNNWNEVYINKNLANWSQKGQIDKFLKKCTKIKIDDCGTLNYRMWEKDKKKMTYFTINFPQKYEVDNIYLKDILQENVGMKFCMQLMKDVIDTQIENSIESKIVIMTQVLIPKN